VDYLGIIGLVLGLGLMQVVLDRGQRADWFSSPWVVYTSAASAAILIFLVFHELRFPEPILDLRILSIPAFNLSVALVVAMSFALYGTGLLNPIFLQEFLQYNAWKAGLVLAPRGFGTMASMLVIGQLARLRYDTRPLVGLGFVVMAGALWTMAQWNLHVSMWVVLWPSLVMGLGMGMIYPTLSATTLSCVERERVGDAASLYSMVRNTGAAVGITVMTTMLVNHEQLHQARLAEHFSVFEAWRMSSGTPHVPGSSAFHYLPQMITGQKQGIASVYQMIQAQAAILSFNDIYRLLAFAMVLLIPSFLLLRKMGGPTSSTAH
jgi:DHA2 family multidrug resistance protein